MPLPGRPGKAAGRGGFAGDASFGHCLWGRSHWWSWDNKPHARHGHAHAHGTLVQACLEEPQYLHLHLPSGPLGGALQASANSQDPGSCVMPLCCPLPSSHDTPCKTVRAKDSRVSSLCAHQCTLRASQSTWFRANVQ